MFCEYGQFSNILCLVTNVATKLNKNTGCGVLYFLPVFMVRSSKHTDVF